MSTTTAKTQKSDTPWWLVLIEGIAALIVGVLLLTATGQTIVFLVQLLGIFWLIKGILLLVNMFIDHTAWGWKLFGGVLGILAGIFVFMYPLYSALLVPGIMVIALGIGGILIGILDLVKAFQGGGWGVAALGILSLIFGTILLFNVQIGMVVLPYVLGIFGIVGGIAAIIIAFKIR